MTILGHFIERDGGYVGALKTLALDAALRFAPSPSENDKAPTHRVLMDEVECGAAWRSADESAVLNVRLDDPSWPEPVRAKLVRGRADDLILVWRRPSPES